MKHLLNVMFFKILFRTVIKYAYSGPVYKSNKVIRHYEHQIQFKYRFRYLNPLAWALLIGTFLFMILIALCVWAMSKKAATALAYLIIFGRVPFAWRHSKLDKKTNNKISKLRTWSMIYSNL